MFYFLLFSLGVAWVQADSWAVLVAGSLGYDNYRHQADICHAYQILHSNGIPNNNIIVMMYDDIAYHEDNPFPGVILNRPGGPNVYTGVPKDYVGENVTVDNFLAVLTGRNATGPVLKSTSEDDVFVYFADHGGPGMLGFPTEFLYAHQLIKALQIMNQTRTFKNLVFYVEACESGSMFSNDQLTGLNIYAVTAANPTQPSYACCWDEDVNSYTGDVYSVVWMNISNSYEADFDLTLEYQYQLVKERVKVSEVCQYGNRSLASEGLEGFITNSKKIREESLDSIVSYDVTLSSLARRYKANPTPILKKRLADELEQRLFYDRLFANSTPYRPSSNQRLDTYCMKRIVEDFEKRYGHFSDYGLKYLSHLSSLCYSPIA